MLIYYRLSELLFSGLASIFRDQNQLVTSTIAIPQLRIADVISKDESI